MTTLEVSNVTVNRGGRPVLDGVTFAARGGELVALMGVSGSGKTTVLRAVAGLDPIAGGTIEVGGVRLMPGRVPRSGAGRMLSVGIVFQFHHLFAHLSALENVSLAPVHVLRRPRAEAERRAKDLLDMLGVGGRAFARPYELSGGEAQRVAIARAVAHRPKVIFADEPTGALDTKTGHATVNALIETARETGAAVIIVTHDRELAAMVPRTVAIRDGLIEQPVAAK